VENVFQIMPHASKGGSGVPPVLQHQRLDAVGRQPQSGHLMVLKASSSAGLPGVIVIGSSFRSSFNNTAGSYHGVHRVVLAAPATVRQNRAQRARSKRMPPTLANGKICYIEIPAVDVRTSADFYQKVFGWHIRQRGDGSIAFDDGAGEVSTARAALKPPPQQV
jgi:hypothetical protein